MQTPMGPGAAAADRRKLALATAASPHPQLAAPPAHGSSLRLVRHGRLPLLLLLRLGQVRQLFDQHSFWAQQRTRRQLVRMLLGSASAVSVWSRGRLVALGRATSDGVFRAVLWDVVVDAEFRSQGLGTQLVEELLRCEPVARAERVYLMTTNGSRFYTRLGFSEHHGQHLLVRYRKKG